MPANHLLSATDATSVDDRLVDSLQQWRDADRAAPSETLIPGLRSIVAHRAVVEQAKGALMLRYGIDSHQAFAVLVRWSRVSRTPVPTIAHTLIHGICQGNPQTELRQRPLIRWLEIELRRNDPEPEGLATAPTGREPVPEIPRPRLGSG